MKINYFLLLTGQDFAEVTPNAFEVGGTVADQVVFEMAPKLCVDALSSPEVQQLYNMDFDLILIKNFMCDCFMDLAEHLQVNYAFISFGAFFLYNILYIKEKIYSVVPHLEKDPCNPTNNPSYKTALCKIFVSEYQKNLVKNAISQKFK